MTSSPDLHKTSILVWSMLKLKVTFEAHPNSDALKTSLLRE